MDKYEYKVRADEIKALIAEGEYAEAVKIADTIDWGRVKSVMMLCTISDLYKINRRYQESKDILLLAYEKHPNGRLIVYSLCELSIKMGEFVQAVEYYKEFVQIAPKDTGKYILQYRLYEAQEVSLEERIAVLEEYKKRDYRERWAYELAYLYHRIGLATKCVEECDEMFLWFGEGKYVLKALELKALHTPLNADQQEKYDIWMALKNAQVAEEKGEKPEALSALNTPQILENADNQETEQDFHSWEGFPPEQNIGNAPTTELPEVKTVDMGQYNTINLQNVVAEGMREILEGENTETDEEATVEAKTIIWNGEETSAEAETFDEPETEHTVEGDADSLDEPVQTGSITEQIIAPLLQKTDEMPDISMPKETDEIREIGVMKPENEVAQAKNKPDLSAGIPGARTGVLTPLNAKPTKYDDVLSQEYDGQISLVIPDIEQIEKQITGQLSINDIMAEWEETKRTNEQKRMEDVRRRILEHTGSLFADFDEATKSGLLEQLEKAFVAAIMKSSEDKLAVRSVVLPNGVEKPVNKAKPETADTVLPEDPLTPEDEAEELAEIEESAREQEDITSTPLEEEESEAGDEAESTSTGVEFGDAKEPGVETEPEEVSVTESEEEPAGEPVKEDASEGNRERQGSVRELTEDEEELFGQVIRHRKGREQLINTLDNMTLDSYTGNIIITGEEGSDTLSLAKGLIREMQYNDDNFSGKIARTTGADLNEKDIPEAFGKLSNGALIIEMASEMQADTVGKIRKVLQKDNMGLILILEDTKKRMNDLLEKNPMMAECFNLRIDMEPLDDEALVYYAKQYAEEQEYSIDEFGVLALHTRIADMQTSDHEVNVAEVREMVDEAIYYANKKTPRHFMDVLLAKRYDDDDMIILRERDFMH